MPTKEEIEMFRNDFTPLLKLFRSLRSGYRDDFLTKRNIDIAKKYADDFSRKYKTIQISVERGEYDLPLPVMLLKSEKDIHSVFSAIERIIPNIQRIVFPYRGKYHSCPTTEFRVRFNEFRPYLAHGKIYFDYIHEKAKRTVKIRYNEKYGAIQLFEDDFMLNEDDPEFELCMHCAFEKGYDSDVDLSGYPKMFIGRTASEPEHFKGSMGGRGGYH